MQRDADGPFLSGGATADVGMGDKARSATRAPIWGEGVPLNAMTASAHEALETCE